MPAERPRAHTLTRREHRKQAPQEKFQAAREANTGTVVALENELGRLRARDEEARTRMRQLEQANDDLERSERCVSPPRPTHALAPHVP